MAAKKNKAQQKHKVQNAPVPQDEPTQQSVVEQPKKQSPVPPKKRAVKKNPPKETPVEEKVTQLKSSSPVPRKKREPITQESILVEVRDLLKLLGGEIERLQKSTDKQKGSKFLKSVQKRVVTLEKHIPKLSKKHGKRSSNRSGFTISYNITPELAKFLQVEPDTQIARKQVQCALSAYIHLNKDEKREKILEWKHLNPKFRDLRDENNKRVILADAKLSKLLDYEGYKKQVKDGKVTMKNKKLGTVTKITSPDLEYCVVMKLIQKHFMKKD